MLLTTSYNYSVCVPTKPCRRFTGFLCSWTVLCYFVFWLYWHDNNDIQHFNVNKNTIESRELLASNLQAPSKSPIEEPHSSVTYPMTNFNLTFKKNKLAIDLQHQPASEREYVADLEKQLPNIPLIYLYDNKNKNYVYKNKTCGKLPTIYDIHFNNIYWQETLTSNGTFYLYGAYLDIRRTNRLGPTIRILGMIDRLEPKVKTYCLMWFDKDKEPVVSKVVEYKYIWFKKWGNYKPGIFQPYLLACQLPKSHWQETPISVSIVEHICDTATNNLKVIYNKAEKKKKDFAVCVKGLDFPTDDLSTRLVEWIELLSLLGADKVFLYQLEIHPNVSKVLDYYVKKGKVDLTPISLPGHQPNVKILQHLYLKSKTNNKRQNELIPYNDCLYRNIYRYKYVALLDIDEVILPKSRHTWAELMQDVEKVSLKVKNESRASYNFRNVYFMDEMLTAHLDSNDPINISDVPEYMHMLRHVYRSANYTKPGQYVKCFHNTDKALILHNHFPLGCLGGPCTSYSVDTSLAHLQHYRPDCVKALKKSCDKEYKSMSVEDTTIWKYKQQLIERSTETLQTLGFLKPDELW